MVFRWTRYFFNVFSLVCFINPLIEKKLLCAIYVPGLTESAYDFNTPIYWLFYVAQNLILYFGVTSFSFYVCIILTFIFTGTTMMQILKHKIKSLTLTRKPIGKLNKTKIVQIEKTESLNSEIVSCIKMHLEIKGYIKTINNLIENILLIECFVSATNMSYLLFVLGSAQNAFQTILYFFVVFYNGLGFFFFCFYGDLLTYEV